MPQTDPTPHATAADVETLRRLAVTLHDKEGLEEITDEERALWERLCHPAFVRRLFTENAALLARLDAAEEGIADLLDTVCDLTAQACSTDGGELDSMASRSYAEALHLLAEKGKVEIIREYGRCVIARWVQSTAAQEAAENE